MWCKHTQPLVQPKYPQKLAAWLTFRGVHTPHTAALDVTGAVVDGAEVHHGGPEGVRERGLAVGRQGVRRPSGGVERAGDARKRGEDPPHHPWGSKAKETEGGRLEKAQLPDNETNLNGGSEKEML